MIDPFKNSYTLELPNNNLLTFESQGKLEPEGTSYGLLNINGCTISNTALASLSYLQSYPIIYYQDVNLQEEKPILSLKKYNYEEGDVLKTTSIEYGTYLVRIAKNSIILNSVITGEQIEIENFI